MAEYLSDIEIAQQARMLPITEVAAKAGLAEEQLECYGRHKAKVDIHSLKDLPQKGKLVLVTAINPTPAGEGKTTTSVGLADALCGMGKNALLCLREPSLGPVFGVKGGAAGGGRAQVVPMEDINLHFTGDFHAIGAANNLLAAMLDNHIQQGNILDIDVRRITWKRCVDMNDRQLRNIVCGLGGKVNGVPREDGFDITVASEIMAVLCLADSLTAAGLSPSRVEGYLEKAGPACLTRTHGRREVAFLNRAWEDVLALDLCLDPAVKLLIIDVMMPKLDGLSAVMKIREKRNLPIIVLSAKSEDSDKVLGLSMGADDYIAKPFHPQELVARVRSQLRRYTQLGDVNAQSQGGEIVNGRLCYRPEERVLLVDGEPVKLTPIEYNILLLLIKNQGRVFSISQIYESIWNEEAIGADNTVAVHIRHIREKIEINPKDPRYLKVVWGVGYKIEKS